MTSPKVLDEVYSSLTGDMVAQTVADNKHENDIMASWGLPQQ